MGPAALYASVLTCQGVLARLLGSTGPGRSRCQSCLVPTYWPPWLPRLHPSALQPLLAAGAGFTGRDAESGMLLMDWGRWLAVLQWALWINTWHEELYYRVIHGDKVSSIRVQPNLAAL